MHHAGRREILVAWGGLWPDWVLFMFTYRSCLPTCYDVDDVLFSCYIRNQLQIRNAWGVTLAQLVKASVGQADVQRFEPHLGHN